MGDFPNAIGVFIGHLQGTPLPTREAPPNPWNRSFRHFVCVQVDAERDWGNVGLWDACITWACGETARVPSVFIVKCGNPVEAAKSVVGATFSRNVFPSIVAIQKFELIVSRSNGDFKSVNAIAIAVVHGRLVPTREGSRDKDAVQAHFRQLGGIHLEIGNQWKHARAAGIEAVCRSGFVGRKNDVRSINGQGPVASTIAAFLTNLFSIVGPIVAIDEFEFDFFHACGIPRIKGLVNHVAVFICQWR